MPTPPKLADATAIIQAGDLPERTTDLCLLPSLVSRYEALQADMAKEAAAHAGSLGGGNIAAIREELTGLREQMQASTVRFRVRGLPRPKFRALKREHPPRKEDDGKPNLRDSGLGVNEETFFEPLLRACLVEPVIDDATFRLLVDERLTDAQYEHLTDLAWAVNVRRVDLPF
jgi:hypothetical protein